MKVELVGGPRCGMIYDMPDTPMNQFMMEDYDEITYPIMYGLPKSIKHSRYVYIWDRLPSNDGSRKMIYAGRK